jgi:predicted ArsR family transcriptional regulator
MSSCPYHKLAQSYNAPCRIDLRLMSLLLPGAKIERTVTEAHRGGICTYTVDLSGKEPA